jgi:CBS domain-containing protein
MTTIRRTALLARDLMRTDVLTLSLDIGVREAVERLEEYRITGAPVVDIGGRLLGFLSLRDIASSEHVKDDGIDAGRTSWPTDASDEDEGWDEGGAYLADGYSTRVVPSATVGDWMTREVFTVSPDATLQEICATMVEAGVHRVLVVEGGALRGIISTFDVVRYFAMNA